MREWAKKHAAAVLAIWRSRIARRQVGEQRDATTGLRPDLAGACYKSVLPMTPSPDGRRPDDAEAYYNRGLAKAGFRCFGDAIADYDAAIELRPDDAKAYDNRGNAKMALNKTDEARSDFKKALDLATEQDIPEGIEAARKRLSDLDGPG